MAPRKQPRVGLRRIDAAIDALRPLGFSIKEVSKCVNNLLKVYGGDDGWTFIEEGSYQLVIESILEQRNEESKKVDEEHGVTEEDKDLSSITIKEVIEERESNGNDMGNASSSSQQRRRPPCYGWISDEE